MEYPKPKPRKQKKAKNNKADYSLRVCALCRNKKICQTHEVYGGIFRQDSIQYGYQVPLCDPCHRKVTNNDETTLDTQMEWKQKFQRQREAELVRMGHSKEDARDIWMEEMRRNYL